MVQVTLNGQQYSSERIVHLKDPLSSYEYYTDPIVTYHHPVSGPSIGGTKVVISGHGFAPFIAQDGSSSSVPENRLWVRFVKPGSSSPLGEPLSITGDNLRNDRVIFMTPEGPADSKWLI